MRTTTAARLLVVAAIITSLSTACRPGQHDSAAALRRSVDRTIDSGSLRFRGRVVPLSGETVFISGVASLTADVTTVTATARGGGAGPSAEVRTTAERAWVRPPGGTEWIPIPRHLAGNAEIGSWRKLLHRVRAASDVMRADDGRLRGRIREGTVVVSLGPTGRIHSISLELPGGSVELDLYDFGVEVEDAPQP